ncbi:MAG: alpha-amylase family glycosyl hydrolase [Bacteroidota bacterium]|nr:alpha-amylase family glycosyl hydrolase [Bacteroidota bacterium]
MSNKQKNHENPKWSYSTNIYEVNLRQYTPEGTFEAFSKSLGRLKDMGIKTLWFMPITPISKTGRLGTLGSYYAAQNYTETNPEFGTLDDFKNLVKEAHEMGFRVILDFVANHTGNDHVWVTEHPEFYIYDENNELLHPHGWSDVSKLNYDVPELREHVIDALKFWVKECDIDGYRCDMAHLVPLDFWVQARKKLSKLKDNLFWLAECEEPEYHKVFDATYTWRWMHASEEFYHNKMNLQSLLTVLYKSVTEFPGNAFRTYFTSNHDENTWNGTEYEKYGDAAQLFAVFSATWNGIPMIYSGQELPNKKRLQFFEKDPIEWKEKIELHNFYKTLLTLHSTNKSLRAGDIEILTQIISHPGDQQVFAYLRKHDTDEVLVILNCCSEGIDYPVNNVTGSFRNVFGGDNIHFNSNSNVYLNAWGYLVFEKTGR